MITDDNSLKDTADTEPTALSLAWFSTHPIQYQTPLLKSISSQGNVNLTVFYFSDFSLREYTDPEFKAAFTWDTPLSEGHKYHVMPGKFFNGRQVGFFNPLIFTLFPSLLFKRFDVILVQGWSHYGYVLAAFIAKIRGTKVLLRCEGVDWHDSDTVRSRVRRFLIRSYLTLFDAVMAIGTINRTFFLKHGVPEEKIGLMPYCVDNAYFQERSDKANVSALRASLDIKPESPVILYASKLTSRKCVLDLISAFGSLSEDTEPHLVIVGDGELRSQVLDAISAQPSKRITFAGFVNQSELPDYYALADIFVLPSRRENWGLVVNEAMNGGCAIIASDEVGAAYDLIKNEENGFVFRCGDRAHLVDCLENALSRKRYQQMGAKSLRIISNWGIKENIDGILNVFKDYR